MCENEKFHASLDLGKEWLTKWNLLKSHTNSQWLGVLTYKIGENNTHSPPLTLLICSGAQNSSKTMYML